MSKPRVAITDAAVKLFSEHGYTGTTMRDIADAVGVLAGSLYAHIDSKETLLVEIVEGGIQEFLAIESNLEASTEAPRARMEFAIKEHINVVAANPERMLVVFHQWRFLSEPNRARAVSMRRRYAQAFSKIIEEGKKKGDFAAQLDTRVAVLGILGALNWVPEWYSQNGPLSAQELGDRFAQTLIEGILPTAGGRSPSAKNGKGPRTTAKSAAKSSRSRSRR